MGPTSGSSLEVENMLSSWERERKHKRQSGKQRNVTCSSQLLVFKMVPLGWFLAILLDLRDYFGKSLIYK